MEIVTYSHAKINLNSIMDRVVDDHVPVAIVPGRGKTVVLVSMDDWENLAAQISRRTQG